MTTSYRPHGRLSWASGMALLVVVCGGCRSSTRTAELAAPLPEPSSGATGTTPVKWSKTITVYTTLSPETLEACYHQPQITNLRPASATPPPVARTLSSAPEPYALSGEWDVSLMRTWSHIVIHHSASETGSAASFDRAHKARGWDGLGYHFVIGNGAGTGDGQVEVGYRWKQQQTGAHAGHAEYNEHGIGICLVGNFETTNPSARQMSSLCNLVRFLQSKAGIATSHVIGHEHVPGRETRCPGRNFNLAAFKAMLGNGAVAADGSSERRSLAAPAASQPSRSSKARVLTSSASVP